MTISAARRFDAIYRSRLRADKPDWHDNPEAIREILGYLDELLAAADVPGRCALGREVVELGCGTGTLSFALAERGYSVLGLDISSVAITQAKAREATQRPVGPIGTAARPRFLVHDVTAPFPGVDGRFALVIDSLVLHYLTRPISRMGMFRLAAGALRHGGALLVMTMCQDPRQIPPGAWFDNDTRCLISNSQAECRYASFQDLTAEFRAAGWRTEYQRIISGNAVTGDQDMFLGVLRPTALPPQCP
jgi:SAM-dependent methyltransferase